MPGGDRTGPFGLGPRTGRAMGFCGGYPVPGYMNTGFGRGFGRFGGRGFGRRFGRGFGWWRGGFPPGTQVQSGQVWEPVQVQPQVYQPTKEEEMKILEEERKAILEEQKVLGEELKEIEKRIEELKKKK